jgi:TetR/AcrR family transcriptional regulator, transcriptional repressor for nem operon
MARPRKFVESDVLTAARDQFWSTGYAATSVDDLTAATGLGKGSLYGAFGDKHALFIRALDEYSSGALADVRSDLREPDTSRGGPDAYQRLTGHVRGMAAIIAADSRRRGCMIAKSAAELASTDPDVARAVHGSLSAWRTELVDCLTAAQREGAVDPGSDAQSLATMLLAVLRGLEALGKAGIGPDQITAAADRAMALLPNG